MKKIFTVALFLNVILANAQNVGIGTSNPQNKLHVGGGFRLDTLTGLNGAGLLRHDANGVVYGIKFSGIPTDVLRGDGTFGSGGPGSVGWLLTGNSGTNAATSFIGTTDNQPLIFRINNIGHGYLSNNIFFGKLAGNSNNSYSNIGIGSGALFNNTNRSGIVAVGDSALFNNSIAVSNNDQACCNTALGYKSLFTNTTGQQNTAVGRWSLLLNTTGSFNTSVGTDALSRNTTGSGNTAVGNWALILNNEGDRNTAIGNAALQQNTISSDNTAVGYFALLQNINGVENTAIGSQALSANTFGDGNTGIGREALNTNNRGSRNVAIGSSALRGNTTGGGNVAVGDVSLSGNVTGNNNVAVGRAALQNTSSGSNNIAIGSFAAILDNGSNGIAIGFNAVASSNEVVLGNGNTNALSCMGAFATTTGAAPNMFVSDNGRIMRCVSAARYKNNIADLEINTSKIYDLRPVSFNNVNERNRRYFGLIAEEVAEIIPELAEYSKEKVIVKGSTSEKLVADGVQYPMLSVLLLKEVQKHEKEISVVQKIIEDQNRKIEKQQQQIDLLLKEIQTLRKDPFEQKN